MSNNESVDLLKKIYENAKTGIDAIALLLPKTHSDNFKQLLTQQQNKYYEIANEAYMQLCGYRELPPEGGVFSKLGMWTSVQMNTVNTKKTDRMAEVMINGSTEGIIEMTKIINSSTNADRHSRDLASRLVSAEQDNIRLMQSYL